MQQPELFAQELLLEASSDGLLETLSKSIDTLWPYECELFQVTASPDDPLVPLANDVVEVVAVSFDRTLLPRASERMLDAVSPGWRSEASDVPVSYIYRGEVTAGNVRLRPPPEEALNVHVLAHVRPNGQQLLPWQLTVVALESVRRLAVGDPLRARPQVAEFMSVLIDEMTKGLTRG